MFEYVFNKALIKRDSQVFFCLYCDFFKSTYFEKHLRLAASGACSANPIYSKTLPGNCTDCWHCTLDLPSIRSHTVTGSLPSGLSIITKRYFDEYVSPGLISWSINLLKGQLLHKN